MLIVVTSLKQIKILGRLRAPSASAGQTNEKMENDLTSQPKPLQMRATKSGPIMRCVFFQLAPQQNYTGKTNKLDGAR